MSDGNGKQENKDQGAVELYRRHRPQAFKQMRGQEAAIEALRGMVRSKSVPRALLLVGPSGCGKTTAARILKKALKCSDTDFREINAAEARGIDTIREIHSRHRLKAMGGDCRIWLLDESHRLTSDAQSSLLKMLEDTPDHVYFMLATTDPQKLLPTIRTRCTQVVFRSLTITELKQLVTEVAVAEDKELSPEVVDRIANYAEGSARKALVYLHQVIGIEDPEKQLEVIAPPGVDRAAKDLCQALLKDRVTWKEVAAILKDLNEDAEGVRRAVLGYAQSTILGAGKYSDRAYLMLCAFEAPLYDTGKPGLTRACYEVASSTK